MPIISGTTSRYETPQERDFRVAAALQTLTTMQREGRIHGDGFRMALAAANPALRWFGPA